MPWFSTSSGRIEISIATRDAASCAYRGDNMLAVKEVMRKPYIKRQLAKLTPELVRQELAEWGAWNAKELKSHEANLMRLIWLACWYISERETQNA